MKICKTLMLMVMGCVVFSSMVVAQTQLQKNTNVTGPGSAIDLDLCCKYLVQFTHDGTVTIDEVNQFCDETWEKSSFLDRKEMDNAYHECWPVDSAGDVLDDGGANDDSDSLAPKVGR
jgi:hypothetical protein